MTTTANRTSMTDPVRNRVLPIRLGDISVDGYVGGNIDRVLHSRILSESARTEIVPEAVQAFVERVDDRWKPGQGFWRGEFWGKWVLSAIAAQKYTGSSDLLQTIRTAVKEVLATQDANGYIGTYHDSSFVHVERGMNWNVWCRKYTLWGLVEAYELLSDPAVLDGACRCLDHLMTEVGPGAANLIETGKLHGQPSTSILTPVVKLYRQTGEQRYLAYAEYIVDQWSRHPAGPPDILRKGLSGAPVHEWFPEHENWIKAYEFMSCVEGLIELHRVTGEADYLRAATTIYADLAAHERLILGGVSDNDRIYHAPLKPETITEVCDAVYWTRLGFQLLCLTGDCFYADEIERTLYNCLCAAMNADATWGVRRLALAGEHWPAPQHCGLTHHHCCVANLPRGLLQTVESAVMTDADGVIVNLFLPGKAVVEFDGTKIRLCTQTEYPVGDTITMTFEPAKAAEFCLRVRIPAWSEAATLTVNGETVAAGPGEYAAIQRTWQTGDQVVLTLDMRCRLTPFPDPAQKLVALERGPLVLARDQRLGGDIQAPVMITGNKIAAAAVTAPEAFLAVFDIVGIRVCDYASAGSTWDRQTSDFRVWLPTGK